MRPSSSWGLATTSRPMGAIQTAGSFVRLGLLSSRTLVREGNRCSKLSCVNTHVGCWKTASQPPQTATARPLPGHLDGRPRPASAPQRGRPGDPDRDAAPRAACLSSPGPRRAHDPGASRTLSLHASALGPCDADRGKPGPSLPGLDRAHGSAAELAPAPSPTPGMVVSASTRRAFCTKQGVRPSRPTSHDLNGAPVQQEAARQDLEAFPHKPPPAHSSCAVTRKPGSP
jgi:hypothetical protein